MSIDLKGNTNYVAFHDLEQGLVVPRTNLSAVDMNVGNGLEVQGDTINIREADAIQIVNGTQTNTVITSEALRRAIMMGSTSALDMKKQSMSPIGGTATRSFNEYGITIDGTSNASISGMSVDGPIAGLSERQGKWLLVFDVYIPVNESVTGFSCTGDDGIIFEAITGYTLNVTEQGSWVRCAALIDTTAAVYTGGLNFTLTVGDNREYAFSLGNIRIQYVDGLLDNEVQYLVLSGKINTTVEGETVVVDGNNAYLFIPGEGIDITDSTISTAIERADTKAVIDGEPDVFVSTKSLSSAISTGKAVDVTSDASVSAGTLDRGLSAKDPVVWTGATGGNIGFYSEATAFPKFADTLVYLMLADVTNNGTANVVINGTNGLNGTLPVTVTPGSTARVAKIFTTQTDGYFSASSTVSLNVTFKLREYEVTGCTNEARAYIAGLEDPDNYNDYYLVDQDSVNPWLNIINMKDSLYTTVMAGLAYKLYANDGKNHTLMVDTIPPNTYGREARLELFVGGTSDITLVAPLRLASGNSFTANTLNNCSIRFQDGLATLTVDSVESSYIVNLAGGTYTTESGTLYAAITSDNDTILFNSDTNGLDCDMHGAISVVNVRLYGNVVSNTILVGSGTFGNYQAKLNSLSFKGATVSGSAIEAEGDIGIVDKLTNNGAISVDPGVNVIVAGAATNSTAMDGSGSMTFGNGATIDASRNETGGIVLGSASNTITVPASATVSFKGLNGYSVDITGSKSGKYLFSNGTLANTFYSVTNTATSGSGSLEYGLTTSTEANILFNRSIDGSTVNIATTTGMLRNVTLIGNGSDNTTIHFEFTANTNKNVSLVGLTAKDCTFYSLGCSAIINCIIDGGTSGFASSINSGALRMVGTPQLIYGSTISGLDATRASRGLIEAGNITKSVFNNCIGNYWCYTNSAYVIRDSIFNNAGVTGYGNKGAANGLLVTGCTFTATTARDSVWTYGSTVDDSLVIQNCSLDANSNVTGRSFDGSITFDGTNKIDSLATALSFKINADAVLDLSNNANSKAITASTVSVPSGTAYVYTYGSNPATDDPVAITGTGNTLLNNGKLGYLVSTATGTGANTLYDALVGNGVNYSNVVFDPAVTSDFVVTGATVTRAVYIDGNGTASTVISGSTVDYGIRGIVLDNMWIKNSIFASSGTYDLTLKNSKITVSGNIAQPFMGNAQYFCHNVTVISEADATAVSSIFGSGSGGSYFYDCNFLNYSPTVATKEVCRTAGGAERCYFERGFMCMFGADTHNYHIKDCVFNMSVEANALYLGYTSAGNTAMWVSGSTFSELSNINTMGASSVLTFKDTNVINGKVIGPGTVKLDANSVLDIRGNTNSTVISGGTITVDPSARVIAYGETTPKAITGSGNTLSNTGVLS